MYPQQTSTPAFNPMAAFNTMMGNNNNPYSAQQSPLLHDSSGTSFDLGIGDDTNDIGFFDQGGGFGNVMGGFNALAGGVNAYTGLKQLGLAEDTFKFNKEAFSTNLANQAKTINSQLEDRQRGRIANNPGAYESLATYMDKNRVSGRVGD